MTDEQGLIELNSLIFQCEIILKKLTYLMVEQRRMNCGDQLNVKYINDFSSRKPFGFPFFSRRCEGAPGLALCYARPKRALEVLGYTDRAHCICIHVVYCVTTYTNNLSRHYDCFG